jgi:hypothetical protein
MNNKFTVVSYYTDNTGYKGEAHRLEASLKSFDISYHIEPIESLGSWDLNTRYKAEFLLEMSYAFDTPIVWLDADAEVLQYPYLFDGLSDKCDMAVYRDQQQQLLSGTIYINKTDKAREILELWILENKAAHISKYEQYNLAKVLRDAEAIDRPFNVRNLPQEYVYVERAFGTLPTPVIMHHQASRRLKREINGND